MNAKIKHINIKLGEARRVALALLFSGVLLASQLLVIEPAGAAIYLRASSAGVVQNSGTSLGPISKPAGTVAGDVMIATIVATGNPTISLTGWTSIVRTTGTTTAVMETFRKTAGSSEPTDYTFTLSVASTAVGSITSYQGVDNTTPVNVSGGNSTTLTTTGGVTNVTANSVTTTVANTFLIANFAVSAKTSFTPPSGMTERFDTQSSCGVLCTDVTGESTDVAQAASGATGDKIATTASLGSGTYTLIGQQVALNPAPPPTLNQAGYRFSVNSDNTDPAYMTSDPSGGDDTLENAAIDTINSVFYNVGYTPTNWIIEKRRIADGSLCTAANCGTAFGTGGQIIQDVASSADEGAYGVAVDAGSGHIYVVGYDKVGGTDKDWRIEKRNMLSGALVSGFGNSGVVQSDGNTAADDVPKSIVLDRANGYLYVSGYDGTGGNQWRIEKRRTSDGALCTAANCGTAFATNGVYTNNISGNDDRIGALEIDPTHSYLYVAGFDTSNGNTSWRVDKMLASTSALCTGGVCGTDFSGDGIYNFNPTPGGDQITTMTVDSAAGAIYLGGYEAISGTQWRIEKITLSDGVSVSAFGTAGAVTSNPSAGDDQLVDIALDGAGGFIYVMGTDANGTDGRWRIEKRKRSDGTLVSNWANSGVSTIDPSVRNDPPARIVIDVDRGLLWGIGGDRKLGTTNMRLYYAELQLDTGTMWLANANSLGGISSNVTFRLRLLIHTTTQTWLVADNTALKLQYAPKVGTCDTGFIGEEGFFKDIAVSGTDEILYHDNPSVADAAALIVKAGEDPTHGLDTVVPETIEESNNFAPVTDVLNSQDGLWDFTLKDNGAFGAYCFRAVYASNSSPLAAYTQVPEVTFCKDDPRSGALMRHGTFFCEGLKKSFFWVQ